MTTPLDEQHLENERLARKYRPFLVLYPEIEDGSRRKDHHYHGHKPGRPPLDQDYHPRDIRFVLDNARLPGMKEKSTREQLLEAMSENTIDYIDLIDSHGPKDVAKFWYVYADNKNKDSNPMYQRKAYAWVVQGSGRYEDYIFIQYWLPYFFDDWANIHEMDWEMVSIILKKSGSTEEPIACVFNAHMGAFRKPWGTVHKVDEKGTKNSEGMHPVAYVANGSHASYFSDYPSYFNVAEKFLRNMLRAMIRMVNMGKDFTDYVPIFEEGVRCFPNIEVIPQPDSNSLWFGDWRWLNFQGKWGSPVQLSLWERIIAHIPGVRTISKLFNRPIRESGITGPNTRGLCWEDPFNWVNLECVDAEITRDWLGKLGGASVNEL
jgi:hypothetical protein